MRLAFDAALRFRLAAREAQPPRDDRNPTPQLPRRPATLPPASRASHPQSAEHQR
jgi:hypothetical protein